MNNSISNLLLNLSNEELCSISDKITFLRQEVLKLTQAQFATALDISQTYLSQIETKKKFVTSAVLKKACFAFNVRLEWFFSDFSEKNNDNIFQADEEIINYAISLKQEEAFHSLCSVFNLQKSSRDFLHWYLSISDEERAGFQQAINFFRKLE